MATKKKKKKATNKAMGTLAQAADSVADIRSPGRRTLEVFPTGLLALDKALGGGLVRGRIYEIAGNESSGKTTLCLEIAKAIQERLKLAVVYNDYEHALELDYARRVGVDVDDEARFVFEQPNCLEDGLVVGRTMIETGRVGLSITDSVAGMIPQSVIDGKGGLGATARALGPEVGKYVELLSRTQTIGLFVNQTRTTFNKFFQATETTPGGKALKFFASVRIFCYGGRSKVDAWRDQGGMRTKIFLKKNKVLGGGRGSAEYELLPDRGFVHEMETLELALEKGLVTEKNHIYTLGAKKFRGREKILAVLRNDKVRTWVRETE